MSTIIRRYIDHMKFDAYIALSFIKFFLVLSVPFFIIVYMVVRFICSVFHFVNYVIVLLCLCILVVMYVLCILFHCVVLCIVCV